MSLLSKPAPQFTLKAHTGEDISLESFAGKQNVLLVFYPLDFSPTCSMQLPEFSAMRTDFIKLETAVLGINRDSTWTHKAWAKEYGIEVPLLADMTLETAKAYGVDLPERGISKRATFLIDKNGTVVLEHIENTAGEYTLHPDDVIEKIKAL
ncbi:MAG: redoxin domain-containing protein [Deinococcales bacterium]